jgi:hypothetical protein
MKKSLFLFLLCASLSTSVTAQVIWQDIAELGTTQDGNDRPRIVTNSSNEPLVIWGNSGNLMYSKWTNNAFSTPIKLNPTETMVAQASWMGPDVTAKGDTVYIVYKQAPEHDTLSSIYCLSSFDGGNNFSAPVKVDDIGNNLSRFTTVAIADNGDVLVAFMKFDINFLEPHWVISRSADNGTTFGKEVEASGFEPASSEACDCCPGSIATSKNTVAMLYRNNASNIRDSWASFSSNNGSSFQNSLNIDQHYWQINECPSTGPNGFIFQDTLYTAFMNAASGKGLTYFNKLSVLSTSCDPAEPVFENYPGLVLQNYPRLKNFNEKSVLVYKQTASGKSQLQFLYSNNIHLGFLDIPTSVGSNYVSNGDVAMTQDKVFIVWEDYLSGTVKYRFGTIDPTYITNDVQLIDFHIYPNPSNSFWNISGDFNKMTELKLWNSNYQLMRSFPLTNNSSVQKIDNNDLASGVYFLQINSNTAKNHFIKLIKK